MWKHKILAPNSWDLYQRNNFNETQLLHLPIHSKFLGIVIFWYSDCLPFVAKLLYILASPHFLRAGSQNYLKCCLPGYSPYFSPKENLNCNSHFVHLKKKINKILLIFHFHSVYGIYVHIHMSFPGSPVIKNPPAMQEMRVWSLGPLEEEMAIHSSILAWEILWTEQPAGYSPLGHKRVRYDLATKPPPHTHTHTYRQIDRYRCVHIYTHTPNIRIK